MVPSLIKVWFDLTLLLEARRLVGVINRGLSLKPVGTENGHQDPTRGGLGKPCHCVMLMQYLICHCTNSLYNSSSATTDIQKAGCFDRGGDQEAK